SPLLVATVIGAIAGAWLGTMIHSNAMLAIIVVTSVISMSLVYTRPNRWLSTADSGRLVPERAGAFIYFLLCFYGHCRGGQRHSAADRAGALARPATEQSQSDQGRDGPGAVCDFLAYLRGCRKGELGGCRLAGCRHRNRFVCGIELRRVGQCPKVGLSSVANQ